MYYRFDSRGEYKFVEIYDILGKVARRRKEYPRLSSSFDLIVSDKVEVETELIPYEENLRNVDWEDVKDFCGDLEEIWPECSTSDSNLPASQEGGGDLPISFSSAKRCATKLLDLIKEKNLSGMFRV